MVVSSTWPRQQSLLATPGTGSQTDRLLHHPAQPQQIDAQGVQAAFVHQGAGHDPVVDEMAGDEPVVRVDIRLGPDDAHAVAPAAGSSLQDPVHQAHPAARMVRGRDGQAGKRGPKQPARSPGAEPSSWRVIAFQGHGHQFMPVRRTDAGRGAQIQGRADDPLARASSSR